MFFIIFFPQKCQHCPFFPSGKECKWLQKEGSQDKARARCHMVASPLHASFPCTVTPTDDSRHQRELLHEHHKHRNNLFVVALKKKFR